MSRVEKRDLNAYHQQIVNARRCRGEQVAKGMKSTGAMTEPWGTPALIECGLEWKLSTLIAIDLLRRKLKIHFSSLCLRPNTVV